MVVSPDVSTRRIPCGEISQVVEAVLDNIDLDAEIDRVFTDVWGKILSFAEEAKKTREQQFVGLREEFNELLSTQDTIEKELACMRGLLIGISGQVERLSFGYCNSWGTPSVCKSDCNEGYRQLYLPPVLPAPAAMQRSGQASISLVAALGFSDARTTPLSASGAGFTASGADTATTESAFTFTLRLADDVQLGVVFADEPSALRVESLCDEGGAAAWNRQCSSSSNGRKRMLLRGDRIVSVNDSVGDPKLMSHEINTKRLLTIRIERPDLSGEACCDSGSRTPTTRAPSAPTSPESNHDVMNKLASLATKLSNGESIIV
mmetsp:Transcript_33780/g.53708  ORF Transcript_33780/g.53708 Transcript_33780/m.53708 type:complete len:320 (-) Transcript_33780:127-1086(-)|eukprot:CAMPEP_0169122610 /NCGR_PEP_ID=MMETSP1015-20121227/33322_1 /TAXON_ID=342587 /ORGANISM="Karlodinium micrum, Strain CCMP2283" /LENGTH=319 /DNA_ID=CAMNT_0009185849 /DNA_START=35 /DNA_END=994 /DNA_ORIENTATION=-